MTPFGIGTAGFIKSDHQSDHVECTDSGGGKDEIQDTGVIHDPMDNSTIVCDHQNDKVDNHSICDDSVACNDENIHAFDPYGVNVVTRSGLSTQCESNLSHNNDVDVKNNTADDVMNNTGNDNDIAHCNIVDAGDMHDGCELSDNLQTSVSRDAVISDQKNNDSLQNCWSLLQQGKGQILYARWHLNESRKNSWSEFYAVGGSKMKKETSFGIWS